MDKVAQKINKTRINWWDAFKAGISLPGYHYYKPPPEIKYRYPAPGSVPHDLDSYPHIFKPHWKTPYKDSEFNIQKKYKPEPTEYHEYMNVLPKFDESNPEHQQIMKEQIVQRQGIEVIEYDEEKDRAALWEHMEMMPEKMDWITENLHPWGFNLDDEYNQIKLRWWERGATGFENQPLMKQIFLEFEYQLENKWGKKRIETKQMDMYKGTTKKWQVLDDKGFDRDQIEKIQAAIKAPGPEELEIYREKHSKPMQLPINNKNVSAWRDDQRSIENADFDPQMIAYDREKKKKFFIERYEKPKELAQ